MAAQQVGLSLGGKAFFGSLCAGTFGLGCWQTSRLFEKQTLTEQRNADLAKEATADTTALQKEHAGSFRRVLLKGTFNHNQEMLVGPRGPPPGALPDGPGTSAAGMSSSPQGYFVITPMTVQDGQNHLETVLVNRGWVPRHLAPSLFEYQRAERMQQAKQRRDPSTVIPETNYWQWNRPENTVQVTVVPAKAEVPRFMVAEHDMITSPPKLFWFDVETMQQQLATITTNVDGSSSTTTSTAATTVPLVTAVRDNDDDNATDANTLQLAEIVWPVQPTAAFVGEFKTSPAIHAGYACTWFGLSGAGLYMTRQLLTRGRA